MGPLVGWTFAGILAAIEPGGRVRIASFNVENLFNRAKALDPANWPAGRAALEAHARLNDLFEEPHYTPAISAEIIRLLDRLGLTAGDSGKLARLRQNRGRLLKRPRTGGVEIVASGRSDWIGWVELTTDRIDELGVLNTARVIDDVGADVVGVIEAESRTALKRFTDAGLLNGADPRYPHVMVVDGNDDRGINVGILTTAAFPLLELRSHVDDTDAQGRIFSRDCPEFHLATPTGPLVVLVTHLKSKGYGGKYASDAIRHRQATRVAQIYARLREEGREWVAVLGDLNDTPGSQPLAPLLAGTDLTDVSRHPAFDDAGRPGTYSNCTLRNKIDYVLLSPALFARTTGGAIMRRGVWGGRNGRLWPVYDTMRARVHEASDHAAIFADVDLGGVR